MLITCMPWITPASPFQNIDLTTFNEANKLLRLDSLSSLPPFIEQLCFRDSFNRTGALFDSDSDEIEIFPPLTWTQPFGSTHNFIQDNTLRFSQATELNGVKPAVADDYVVRVEFAKFNDNPSYFRVYFWADDTATQAFYVQIDPNSLSVYYTTNGFDYLITSVPLRSIGLSNQLEIYVQARTKDPYTGRFLVRLNGTERVRSEFHPEINTSFKPLPQDQHNLFLQGVGNTYALDYIEVFNQVPTGITRLPDSVPLTTRANVFRKVQTSAARVAGQGNVNFSTANTVFVPVAEEADVNVTIDGLGLGETVYPAEGTLFDLHLYRPGGFLFTKITFPNGGELRNWPSFPYQAELDCLWLSIQYLNYSYILKTLVQYPAPSQFAPLPGVDEF